MGLFQIDVDHFTWICGPEDDPEDLCLHGHVTIQVGETKQEYTGTVSATGLYLLKTLTEDKVMCPHDIQMVPCCGFFLVPNQELTRVSILGCDQGLDWFTEHEGDGVRITLATGECEWVDLPSYRQQVLQFVQKVEGYYRSCQPKQLPEDDFERNGYLAFWNEWHQRYEAARKEALETGQEAAPGHGDPWEVTFEGGFWKSSGEQPGEELPIHKEFDWAGHRWIIPSVYLCGKGLVVDFCMRVEPDAIGAFMEKWNLCAENEAEQQFTQAQQRQLNLDNPMHVEFHSRLYLNGTELHATHRYGTSYHPCLGPEYVAEDEAKRAVAHYGLDANAAWVLMRSSFPWAAKEQPELHSLSMTMIQDKVSIPGPCFQISAPGDTLVFSYGGQEHTLTVQEYESKILDRSHMPDSGLEYPSHYVAMRYTVTPELPEGVLTMVDCDEGDRPRQLPSFPGQPVAAWCAAAIGVIGGADGPVVLMDRQDKQRKLLGACSSLHFEAAEPVTWQMLFHEKQFADTTVDLVSQ